MKKSNSILQAAVVAALLTMTVGAQAGNMATTTRTFATENFGATQAATVAVTPAAVSYSVSNAGGVTVAVGQTTTLYLRLSGTHVFAAAPAAAAFSGTVVTALGVPTAVAIGTGVNANTMAVTFTNGTAGSVNLPVNSSIIWTPATAVTATSSALATVGGTISVTGSLSGIAVNTAATTLPSDQDPVSAAAIIATSASAISGVVTSAAAFTIPETARINLGATPAASLFTTPVNGTTALINLGSYTFTNNAIVTPTTLAGGAYALPAAAAVAGAPFAGNAATIAPNGGSFPVGATLYADSAITCAAGTATSNVVTITASTVGTAAVLTAIAAAATPGTALPTYICMTVPGTAAGVITPITPTAAVSLTKTVATDAANTIAATALFPLQYNGSLVDVRSYIPAAAVGYQSFIRVINTGGQAAPVTGQFVNIDGTTGTAANIIASLPVGGAVTLTAAQVEAALGAPAGGAAVRPRLRVTAPTTGLNVQSFMSSPAGVFTDMTGAQ